MRVDWRDLDAAAADGATVEIEGFPVAIGPMTHVSRFILTAEPGCCPGCLPRDRSASVEVFVTAPIRSNGQAVRLRGTWRAGAQADGWRYQLYDARLLEPQGWRSVTRRGVMAAGPLMCLAACAGTGASADAGARAGMGRDAIAAGPTVDIHSHAGGIASANRIRSGIGFGAISRPMRQGGMAAICLAVVSDSPTHRVMPDGQIHPYREPEPGELYQYGQLAFGRVHDLAREQGLALITDAASLRAARAGTASAIIAAEGADFLEGRVDRVDEAYAKWHLRHLQLTHYRVNELGDIQTEPPVHGGLTDVGAEVIRRCNRIGAVVDVAHGTYDLVKRAVTVATKPMVLSHTSLLGASRGKYTRRIAPAHARLIAETGGVIGVWPPASEFGTLTALATGMARMVDVVGVDHVGLGSDMRGLVGPSIFPDYDHLPGLADALLDVGFNAADTGKILGGNYARVFEACMA